jgi:4-diphosphocytidyl-2-C-methyl-D-erythritol kinase
MDMRVTLRSYAKINLGLAIGPLRPDRFHALATVYQTIDAHDLVTVALLRPEPSAPRIEITTNDTRVPTDARNTVWKMLEQALAAPGREGVAVRVHIEKRLPVQGGMGAGSANAAAALTGLERLLSRQSIPPLAGEARLRIAASVGSDVPLFLLGGTVLGQGRGEEVLPIEEIAPMAVVVAIAGIGVSTPAAFVEWDRAQESAGLTAEAQADRLTRLSRTLATVWCGQYTTGVFSANGEDQAGTLLSTLVQTGILRNDFEQVVFRQHPFLETIKHALSGNTSVYTALSGSGSAVFGLYKTEDAAVEVEQRLNRQFRAMGVRVFRTQTLDRPAYWSGMVVRED